jgi:hypothetical protein
MRGETGKNTFYEFRFFSNITPILSELVRVTPSLPQWGKQPKGSLPLTPISDF